MLIILKYVLCTKLKYHFFKNIYLLCIQYSVCVYALRWLCNVTITDGCEPPCGCWELNSGPLEEQAMLLTAEPSLQPQNTSF